MNGKNVIYRNRKINLFAFSTVTAFAMISDYYTVIRLHCNNTRTVVWYAVTQLCGEIV